MAFYSSPLAFLHVTSGWQDDRSYRGGMHEGVDLSTPVGTPVFAAASGKVFKVQKEPNGKPAGIYVGLDHGDYRSRYMHLSKALVAEGQVVSAGQQIGLSGRSGTDGMNSTTEHLHFDTLAKSPFVAWYERLFGKPKSGFFDKGGDFYAIPSEALLSFDKIDARVKKNADARGVSFGSRAGMGLVAGLALLGVGYYAWKNYR